MAASQSEPVYRLCARTVDVPDMPELNPSTIQGICYKCHFYIWVDGMQQIPFPNAIYRPICMQCALNDAELRESIVKGFGEAARSFFEDGVILPFDKDGKPIRPPAAEVKETPDAGLSGDMEGS